MHVFSFTGGLASTNAWLLEFEEKRILFDAPTGTGAWLDSLGVLPDAIALTHQHWDHVQDLAAVVAATGAEVWAWDPTGDEKLTLAKRFEQNFGIPCAVPAYAVDHVLGGKSETVIAGVPLGLRHVPGHSPDSVCFLAQDALVCGDTLMAGSMGRTDLPHSEPDRFMGAIREGILSLGDAVRLLPGHGPETSVGHERVGNPWLQG